GGHHRSLILQFAQHSVRSAISLTSLQAYQHLQATRKYSLQDPDAAPPPFWIRGLQGEDTRYTHLFNMMCLKIRENMIKVRVCSCIYLGVFVALTSVGLNSSNQATDDTLCSSCNWRQNSKSSRLEAIKMQILSKLRLEQAPNISKDAIKHLLPKAPPLEELIDQYDVQSDDSSEGSLEEDDYHATTETIITMSTERVEPHIHYCNGRPHVIAHTGEGAAQRGRCEGAGDFLTPEKPKCCYFKFSSIMQYNKIAKAQLWIYLKPVQKRTTVFIQTFRSPRYLNDNLRSTGIRPLKLEMNPGPGIWKNIDVKNALQNWLKQLESNIGIEIKATDENGRDIPVGYRGSSEGGMAQFVAARPRTVPAQVTFTLPLFLRIRSNSYNCALYPLYQRMHSNDAAVTEPAWGIADGNQGKHRVTKRGPALSNPMFTLVTGIVGRWRAVCVTALQRPNSDAAAIRIVVGIAAASLSVMNPFIEVKVMDTPKRTRRDFGLDCDEHSAESRCCRYPLTVDFEAFGWDWIIAPKRYKANYCSGECGVVFLQKYPHTHLVQQVNPRGSAGPCCTPTKMSPINMLYFNENEQIIYGKIPAMVVDRCGCS
ncbi:unnamed protein product, partial [Ranitomeya imitator]